MQPESLYFLEIGKTYFFPTIGPAYIGRVKAVSPVAFRLEAGACWVRQTGNDIEQFFASGNPQESFTIPNEITIPVSICQPWIDWHKDIPA